MKSLHLVNGDQCYYASSIIKNDGVIREKERIFLVHLFFFLTLINRNTDLCERPSLYDERYRKEIKRTTFANSTFDLHSHACTYIQDVC